MIRSFVVGALLGGLAVWRWRDEFKEYVANRTRWIRAGAADGLQSVEATATSAFDHAAQPLRRAEAALDHVKGQVRDALRTGQGAIRPEPRL